MERLSILIDKGHLDISKMVGYNIEKAPEFLCEHCGIILSTKQYLKCPIVIRHSEKVTTSQCGICPATCNRLDNIRRHVRKHSGQTSIPKTVMYEIKEMSPEPAMPKRPRPMPKKTPLSMRPHFNGPMSTNAYIYKQTLKTKESPPTWRLIPIHGIPTMKPIRRPKDLLPISYDPKLDLQTLQDLEEWNWIFPVQTVAQTQDPYPGPNRSSRPP